MAGRKTATARPDTKVEARTTAGTEVRKLSAGRAQALRRAQFRFAVDPQLTCCPVSPDRLIPDPILIVAS
jgi:hypothetical protein